MGCEQNYRKLRIAIVNLAQHLQTVHPRQTDIEIDQIIGRALQALQRFDATRRRGHFATNLMQDTRQRLAQICFVIDNQNTSTWPYARLRFTGCLWRIRCRSLS